MIYPTRRPILIAAAAAPAALVIGVAVPAYWTAGLGIVLLLLALCALDALLGAAPKDAEIGWQAPAAAGVGEAFPISVTVRFARERPSFAETAIGVSGPAEPAAGGRARIATGSGGGSATLSATALRRGTAAIESIWMRWRGPLGLVWKQKKQDAGGQVAILPDIRPLRQEAVRFLNREAVHGMLAQLQQGEGTEFEALTEYRQGMDRRAIDWKQSARHRDLIAKEFRTERNNNIVMALDSGRAMSEPLGGVPRIDRAVSAALLTAFVALKQGDRVGLLGFDSHPRAFSRPVAGGPAFSLLQQAAARIDYSSNETNYTLALASLASLLTRRSLVVVFTEFTDSISAELMLASVGALLKRHLVLFIVLADEELEGFASAEPNEPEDVSRAVTAASLLLERQLVITKLRRLGVHLVEAPADRAGPALVSAYLDLKRRNLI